jgi:hypothetical protein
MNLVEQIEKQLSSGVINQLVNLTGASEGAAGSAVKAAVPSLLSALASLASSSVGAQKLLSVLSQFSSGSVESLVSKMTNQPSAVHEQGADLLSSLLGGNILSGIVSAVSRFAGIAPGATQKLVAYMTPLLLGTIASRFTGKQMNAQGLASMLGAETANIARALPSGFSLNDVPGLAATGSAAARSAIRGVEAAGSSLARWLWPVAGLAALGLLLWWFASSSTPAPEAAVPNVTRAQSPEIAHVPAPQVVKNLVPDVTKFSTELTDTFSKLTESLTSVKDVASAEAALPELQDLEGKLDVAKTTMNDLGSAGKASIITLVKATEGKLRDLIEKVLAIPGVGEKIKPVVDSITAKLTELGV